MHQEYPFKDKEQKGMTEVDKSMSLVSKLYLLYTLLSV